jgi:hypothetical protein
MPICAECHQDKPYDELFPIRVIDIDEEILVCEDCIRNIEDGNIERQRDTTESDCR